MIDFETQLRKACAEIDKFGAEFAECAPEVDYLDNMKKTIFAAEVMKAGELPAWKAEAHAYSTEVYKIHLKAIKEMRSKSLIAKAKLEAARARYESLRTLCSLQKTQMSSFHE